MELATESNIDYAVQARTALAAVERLTSELDAVERKTGMCREKWRDYGAALLMQRALMPSTQEFGHWVKEHGLDLGVASTHSARSDAMWLAEHFADVSRAYIGKAHHPSTIRRQCREAEHAWAYAATEGPLPPQPASTRDAPYSWQKVAADEGVPVLISGTRRTAVKRQLQALDADPQLFDAEHEPQLRAALIKLRAQQVPESITVTSARDTLTESQHVRFEKAVARATAALEAAYEAKNRALQGSYEQAVSAAVEARIAAAVEAERKRLAEAIDRNTREMQTFILRRDGIKHAMTKLEWQAVLGCLHPDRAPEDRRTQFSDAFVIVRRLKAHVES